MFSHMSVCLLTGLLTNFRSNLNEDVYSSHRQKTHKNTIQKIDYNMTRQYNTILMKRYGMVRHNRATNRLDFE